MKRILFLSLCSVAVQAISEHEVASEWYSREEVERLAANDTFAPPGTTRTPQTLAPIAPTNAPATNPPITANPSTGSTPILQWCQSDAECQTNGDTAAKCNMAVFQCQCSKGWTLSIFAGNVQYWDCVRDFRTVVLFLFWSLAACVNGELPRTSRVLILGAAKRKMGGKVKSLTFICGSAGAVIESEVDSVEAVTLTTSGVQDAIQAEVQADPVVASNLGNTVSSALSVQAATTVAVPTPPGSTPTPTTPSPPVTGGLVACTLDNAEAAFTVPFGGSYVCSATTCNEQYILEKKLTGYGHDCVPRPANFVATTCLTDTDCTSNPTLKTCISETCQAGTPAPTKIAVIVQPAAASFTSVCSTNADCRPDGHDPEATCTFRPEGSFCTCNTLGYGYPTNGTALKVCVPAGVNVVSIGFKVRYASGSLAQWTTSTKQEFANAIQRVLGSVQGDVLALNSGGLELLGRVSADTWRMGDYISGSSSLRAELAKIAGFTGRDAIALGLSELGVPTSAGTWHGATCVTPNALVTATDQSNVCHALSCVASSTLSTEGNVQKCTDTSDDSDDGLTDSEKAIIGICVGVFLLMVGVIMLVVYCMRKGRYDDSGSRKGDSEFDEPIDMLV